MMRARRPRPRRTAPVAESSRTPTAIDPLDLYDVRGALSEEERQV